MNLFCKSALLGVSLFASCSALGACNSAPDPRLTNFQVQRDNVTGQYDPTTGRLARLEVDRDRNGYAETRSYWDGVRLIRIEVDLDENGVVDRWEHYDARARMVKIGTSSANDGVEDTWSYPSEDAAYVARIERDTTRDGRVDKWEEYDAPTAEGAPVLRAVGLDLDNSGQPTRWLHYHRDGTFDRLERVP